MKKRLYIQPNVETVKLTGNISMTQPPSNPWQPEIIGGNGDVIDY